MRKAYIILAHKNEAQVRRLIDKLNDYRSVFFLHIDLNVTANRFEILFSGDSHVHLVNRVRTNWGGFGLVEATLNAMQAIRTTGEFDRIILLSGQDYPIKTNEEIDVFFQNSNYRTFMDHFSLPNHAKWGHGGGMYRVNKYFFGLSTPKRFAAKVVNFLAMFIPPINRKAANGLMPFSGSQWWAMDMHTLNYVLDYVAGHPEYVKFHKHTFAPDELFFQMILLNCEDQSVVQKISNNNLRYMQWRSKDIAHPEVLKINDIKNISESTALFARKFDIGIDESVINEIDKAILS